MKKTIALVSLSVAGLLLFAWMLATPIFQINPTHSNPAVADGGPPVPPPPYLMADGGPPVPPPPYLVADGGPPVPPPPYNA
jgi:hypothetical protein